MFPFLSTSLSPLQNNGIQNHSSGLRMSSKYEEQQELKIQQSVAGTVKNAYKTIFKKNLPILFSSFSPKYPQLVFSIILFTMCQPLV